MDRRKRAEDGKYWETGWGRRGLINICVDHFVAFFIPCMVVISEALRVPDT